MATKQEIEAARARWDQLHPPAAPSSSAPRDLGATLEQRRLAAARKAGRAYAAQRRAQLRRQDLDPAKRQRDLAALDPETRRRVENYDRKTHL